MNALPLSLSLSSSFTEVGAIAAFAALLGIAILSLLAFSQAREIKRLREWAGRAPERASELEQRVSTDAGARVQRGAAPAAPTRAVPRKTPLVSAPVSTAVNATVAAGRIGTPPTPIPPNPAAPHPIPPNPAPPTSASPANVPPTPVSPTGPPHTPAGAPLPDAESTPKANEGAPAVAPAAAVASEEEQDSTAAEDLVVGTADGATVSAAEKIPAVEPARAAEERRGAAEEPEEAAEEPAAAAPATAAARAAGVAARAPLPPSPAAPAPPGALASGGAISGGVTPAAQSPRPVSRTPSPVAAARRTPSRAVAGQASDAPLRPPAPPRALSSGATVAGARTGSRGESREPGSTARADGPKYFKPERSPGRATALIVGGVIVGVVLLVFAVSALKGGGSSPATATQSPSSGEAQPTSSHTTAHATASKPSETAVVVLNGTSTAGLAHHLAADLQQSGYTKAAALGGVPPGTHASTVVQYTSGHRADAQAVAKALNVTQVQAVEPSTAALAGSATVVVLAGTDQASLLGGGGAQSKGEPAAGTASTGASGETGAGTGAGSAAGAGEAPPAGAGEEGTAGSGH